MLKMMRQRLQKKNGKKGFTLVEVIVVLVILAILAAIAIPALTGYISRANDEALISQARTCLVALQTESSAGTLDTSDGAAIKQVDQLSSTTFEADKFTLTGIAITGAAVIDTFVLTDTERAKKCTYDSSPAAGEEKFVVSKVS